MLERLRVGFPFFVLSWPGSLRLVRDGGYGVLFIKADMNLLDSVRRMVRAYPGGLEAVAPRLDKSPSTLEKELRGAPGFKLGAEDAAEISAMCFDLGTEHARAYANAFAARVNCLLVPLPPSIDTKCPIAMQALAEASRESAELISEACNSLSDGKVSDNELRRFDGALGELLASAQALRSAMATINSEGKPKGASA